MNVGDVIWLIRGNYEMTYNGHLVDGYLAATDDPDFPIYWPYVDDYDGLPPGTFYWDSEEEATACLEGSFEKNIDYDEYMSGMLTNIRVHKYVVTVVDVDWYNKKMNEKKL